MTSKSYLFYPTADGETLSLFHFLGMLFEHDYGFYTLRRHQDEVAPYHR